MVSSFLSFGVVVMSKPVFQTLASFFRVDGVVVLEGLDDGILRVLAGLLVDAGLFPHHGGRRGSG